MTYLSECCDSIPHGELDMTTIPYGGPSGFCSTCHDNCIFIVEDVNIMPTKEEALEHGRKLYKEIFGSPFADSVLEVLDTGEVDDILYAIFHDSVQEGYIIDVADECPSTDGSPTYIISAIRLRTIMCASLTVGMWHQKITNSLDDMWGVDKL